MENFIILTSIGKALDKNSFSNEEFTYAGVKYEKLLLWDQFDKLINLHKSSGFFLQNTFVNGGRYLALCYSLNPSERHFPNFVKSQRDFVISSFFEAIEPYQVNHDEESKTLLTLDNFYEKIKQEHESDDLSTVPQNVQHPGLKESTRLRPYQMRGIKWLLKRELESQELPSNYIKMRSKFNPDQIMYFNPSTKDFVKQKPEELLYPPGGLLCDEMGLGKTVEMITLILMNPRPKSGLKQKYTEFEDIPLKTVQILSNFKGTIIKCICHKNKKSQDLIKCSMCFNAQHKSCVGEVEEIFSYICPICYKSTNRIIESHTTMIVSPTSIKRQWMSEIQRHVQDKSFKVLLYNGIGNGWISPEELAKYDIVITDFATLSRELYFAESIDRQLRQIKKFEYPPSPLIHMQFWRVILDEAQMVENANTRPAQMVQTLPAVHRWGCTGTPIEKGSIQHLYGLIFFLGIYPYTVYDNFNGLWNEYRNGKPEKLIQFLSKIMWRTCKKDVEHEIEIPPQQEIIHYVEMSDLQKCFYRQVHQTTQPEFQKHIFNFISYYDREKKMKVADYSLKEKALYELNNATLKTLLEPLRMLRQDCTIANLFTNANDHTRVKQTLHADQLHDHLVKKTTIECKSALRTICSSLNGIAALKIAEEKYDEAIGMYKQVLRLAKDYNAPNGVHVDSMLQIHSFNSLIELAVLTQKESELANKDQYTNDMMTLEWKYVGNYYEKVQNINEELDECRGEFKKASKDYKDRDGHWWRDIISVSRTHEEEARLVEQINMEFFSGVISGGAAFAEHVRSTHGIQLILTEWCDKIERFSKEVHKRFKNFDFIIKDLKPSNELSDEVNEKINRLAKAALDCHLNLFEEEDEQPIPKNPANLCELCKLKRKLDEYECVLFNKALVNDIVAGSWNPRLEERLLKVIFNNAKRLNFDEESVEMGKFFFKYLEALKKQYKMLAQLWVELNFTVSAYDELNMCKTRMQVVENVEEITEEDARFRLKITKHEVEDQIEIFSSQKHEAELLFTRLNGRLKYLDHLKDKNEIPICPICTVQAKERYYVTVCGHSICAECFLKLTKDKRRFSNYERLKINCPVCRTQQEIGNILAVTCNAQLANAEPIVGNYSPKIDEIIRCVLRLRREEPDVKILIFSQWDSILTAIITGLRENQVTYRASFSSNFSKQIEEFKDFTMGVTCMMLNLKFAGKGLNLTEATHAFLVEPILNADEELQAIGRIHRIGQTRETFVHKFITKETIEETLYNKIIQEKDKWIHKQFTIADLESLFEVEQQQNENDLMELF